MKKTHKQLQTEKEQLEAALTKLLCQGQDEDTLIEMVRQETGREVRLVRGELCLRSVPTFRMRVVLENLDKKQGE